MICYTPDLRMRGDSAELVGSWVREVRMRSTHLVLVVLCGVVLGPSGIAQVITEAVQIDKTSVQAVGTNGRGINPLSTQGNAGSAAATEEIQIADPPRALPDCRCTARPEFSILSGNMTAGFEVSIAGAAKDAVIYYTTDGWTPTLDSARYAGPIHVGASLRLQAIAVEPEKLPSAIAEADYMVSGAGSLPHSVDAPDGVLRQGTELRLMTHTDIGSDDAQVGDPVALQLDEDVMSGGTVMVPKGSAATAVLTRVQRAGPNGRQGELVFQVQSLTAGTVKVPLAATLTLAASDPAAEQRIANASMVHVAGALPRGEDAEITPGMRLTARVKADTALQR